ncbi:hypothetical protein [Thermococcus sp.]|uniref:hypothetical protein n=1 Tax=Thermococcus sp. TaxID=35749 RepID=UPI00261DCB0E|nr:hypothetical protein [Thermococcus sp.]
MKLEVASGISLIAGGGLLALHGFIRGAVEHINLGIAGMFLGAILLTFKGKEYIKKESVELVGGSYESILERMVRNLALDGNAIFIPPYDNLPKGGLFVPLHEDFDLDLARLDENKVFLTDVPREKAMGLFLGPVGTPLVEKFEEHLEGPLNGIGSEAVESVASSVLKTLGLAEKVYIEEEDDTFRVIVDPSIECNVEDCEKTPCPICASVLLALAKGTNELLLIESVYEKEYGIEMRIKKLGGVEEWM